MKLFRRCTHERTRCIHGEEILLAMTMWRGIWRRQRCLDCGKALDRDLPAICTYTRKPHTPTAQETA